MGRHGRNGRAPLTEACTVDGCRRWRLRGGLCRVHAPDDLPTLECGHEDADSIVCAVCQLRCCLVCYGHPRALACVACTLRARYTSETPENANEGPMRAPGGAFWGGREQIGRAHV